VAVEEVAVEEVAVEEVAVEEVATEYAIPGSTYPYLHGNVYHDLC
jgi:hypothetical protein